MKRSDVVSFGYDKRPDGAPIDEGSEVLSTPNAKGIGGLPKELHRRKRGAPPKQPALWTSPPTHDHPEPDDPPGVWGSYPKGFLQWAVPQLQCAPSEVLHLCSGAIPRGVGRARVDLRRDARPDVVADARQLPFADASFAAVMIDPPYSVEYARDLYGIGYPRPSHLLAEASRVLRPCGRVGILHFLVPMPPKDPRCSLVSVRGVTTGCGYRIRAFSVFEREQDGLPL